ncbi:related to RPH1 - Transcriptional repressor of PHR1 [Ustilago trichophora]|uniref:[histone H3]-trimethyl-L-lysine(9) demethylase n=1 Tax=Ustilago trichophora TaxID=86804 RepID=A0A5C3EHY0_9BASI|nr:related to RPH1 - Transcriptional repressor of PHR1 [Ustilago trichophora]
MSISDAAMIAASPQHPVVPTKQLDMTEQLASAQSPRLPQLDALAASASSPSNDMSPAHPPTESSRHSTPATSAAGSDHAQSTSQFNQSSSSKLPHQSKVEHSTAAPQPSTSPPPNDQHTLASIEPAYFYPADGSASSSHDGIPVFEPTMHEFHDFYAFCQAIDTWGMQYGIVKVVAPKEWRDSLPDLRPLDRPNQDPSSDAEQEDELADISKVRIRNAITQHFTPAGSGVWRQTNITRTAKIWNAKQWADTCISEGQKGPEMDRMKWKVEVEGVSNGGWGPKNIGTRDSATSAILEEDGVRTRSGKARPSTVAVVEPKSNGKRKRVDEEDDSSNKSQDGQPEEPSTSALPPASPSSPERRSQRIVQSAVKTPCTSRDASPVKPKKNWEAEATTHDEWCAFDYKNCWRKEALSSEQIAQLNGNSTASTSKLDSDSTEPAADDKEALTVPPTLPSPSEWTPEVCREIESEYWRSLNFGKPPMYGADLKGTLFDDRTQHWNVGKLDNVLTRLRLRRKLPGVNTPYLYWGMWRATFAWHVEDMDLYSINYIHFGAPKQWYAIRQADRQRFESAMAGAFPSDSRRCPHFMRHKSYLASPSFLASHGIRPLKLVHNAGEFVITYPYGYHSGFNMGYNCAESVNFALESWLDIGRKANYCHCDQSQNSVRIDVDAMLEESKEMEELERKRELRRAKEDTVRAIEEEDLEKRRIKNEKAKERRKQKKEAEDAAAAAAAAGAANVPAISLPFQGGVDFYVDPKEAATSPCIFCPANVDVDLVPTPSDIPSTNPKLKAMADRHAHRLCASFVPETWVGKQGKAEVVCGIEGIDKARFSLKCQICPNPALQKLYPKIQCTRGKCPRSAHVSCALVEDNGWFLDVCPAETADRLEGKKTSSNAQQADGLEDGERLVVLCKTHNPLFREAEEARKADELRERIHSLPIPSMVKIKTSGGMFQALMVEVSEEADEITIEDEGRPSTVKFQQIILDSPAEDLAVKEEPQAPAVASTEVVVAADGGDAAPPAKRRRKASEKASANAKAANEEAVEASIAAAAAAAATATTDDDAAGAAPAPKRTRKLRAKAEPAATETVAELPAVYTQKNTPAKKAKAELAEPKPKQKRQAKKKAQTVQPADAAEVVTSPLDAQQMPLPPVSWPGHPSQHPQQQLQPQPQALPPATKRGPRATYAAQPPGSQPHYAEHRPQFQSQHQHQHQHQQQYPGPEYGQMYRNQPYPSNGDAVAYGNQYGPSHSSAYPSRNYDPEAERHHMASRYAQSSVSAASPSYGHSRPSSGHPHGTPSSHPSYQQHPAYPHPDGHVSVGGNTPQSRHSALAATSSSPAPPLMSSATSTPSSASQYGYIAAPAVGYRDRSPPLPTYSKPLAAHQPQHLPHGGELHGYPDYRPPYNHHPLHPSYQLQQQGQLYRQQRQQQQYGYGADGRTQQQQYHPTQEQQGGRTRYTDEQHHNHPLRHPDKDLQPTPSHRPPQMGYAQYAPPSPLDHHAYQQQQQQQQVGQYGTLQGYVNGH